MANSPAPLVLASTSRYRKNLLERLQIPFQCQSPGVDEQAQTGEPPEDLALRLATAKAAAVSRRLPVAWVLGSDQVASLDGERLRKPGTEARARDQLRRCSGRIVRFHTAVSLSRGDAVLGSRNVPTDVQFRELSDAQISDYVSREQPLDCAGSFRWEALGIALFTSLRSDDPTALEGLPLISTCDLLRENGLYILNTTS